MRAQIALKLKERKSYSLVEIAVRGIPGPTISEKQFLEKCRKKNQMIYILTAKSITIRSLLA